ncbi:MAG: amidase [Deltaproteobacteria bacterium]|nr:amidase [Deltaproteobacteria bacterium]
MNDPYQWLDAVTQAALVRQGEVTPRELVEAAIARAERVNPALNAIITPLYEKARAASVDPRLPAGPFHGVPMLLKDIFGYSAGDAYHMGMQALRDANFLAPHDTHLVTKLRRAGFVFLGRTNAPELGTIPSTEPLTYGPTHNPWDPTRSPGGSSGGSAAAVAAGVVAVAHANDGGGSIRIPASACGVVGLKPSRGRVSFGPDLGDGVGGLAVEGCVSRTVRDTAAFLDVVEGLMPGDPYGAPPPQRPYREEVGADPGTLRIGVMTQAPAGSTMVDPDCVAAVEGAAALLGELGHRVESSHPTALDDMETFQHFGIMFATSTARILDAVGELLGRTLGPEDVEPFNWALAEMGRVVSARQYLMTADWLFGYTRRVADWWAGGFDVLLTPTLPEPPWALGGFHGVDPMMAGLRAQALCAFTGPFNMTGQPAISLPLAWNANGLPIGVQLVAAYGREDLLLRVAAQLERARPWIDRHPPIIA